MSQKVLSSLTNYQRKEVSNLFGSALILLGLYNITSNYLILKAFEVYGSYWKTKKRKLLFKRILRYILLLRYYKIFYSTNY